MNLNVLHWYFWAFSALLSIHIFIAHIVKIVSEMVGKDISRNDAIIIGRTIASTINRLKSIGWILCAIRKGWIWWKNTYSSWIIADQIEQVENFRSQTHLLFFSFFRIFTICTSWCWSKISFAALKNSRNIKTIGRKSCMKKY